MDNIIDRLMVNVDSNTKSVLADLLYADLHKVLVNNKFNYQKITPHVELVFNAFVQCPIDTIRVVICNTKPYCQYNNGLCLSSDVKILPPLMRLYESLRRCGLMSSIPTHGDLTCWAKRGVLLLNAELTRSVGSHAILLDEPLVWDQYTDRVIAYLGEKSRSQCVFLFLGSTAVKAKHIIGTHHIVLFCNELISNKDDDTLLRMSNLLSRNPINWNAINGVTVDRVMINTTATNVNTVSDTAVNTNAITNTTTSNGATSRTLTTSSHFTDDMRLAIINTAKVASLHHLQSEQQAAIDTRSDEHVLACLISIRILGERVSNWYKSNNAISIDKSTSSHGRSVNTIWVFIASSMLVDGPIIRGNQFGAFITNVDQSESFSKYIPNESITQSITRHRMELLGLISTIRHAQQSVHRNHPLYLHGRIAIVSTNPYVIYTLNSCYRKWCFGESAAESSKPNADLVSTLRTSLLMLRKELSFVLINLRDKQLCSFHKRGYLCARKIASRVETNDKHRIKL